MATLRLPLGGIYTGDYVSIKNAPHKYQEKVCQNTPLMKLTCLPIRGIQRVCSRCLTAPRPFRGSCGSAGSIDELAAAINEISYQVRETAANMEAARRLTAKAGNRWRPVTGRWKKCPGNGEIGAKTEQIRAINNTIEEIAFQTNILALNAAVELRTPGNPEKVLPWLQVRSAGWPGNQRTQAKRTSDLH